MIRSAKPTPPRVAFFPDSFHEVNGVAHTSRNFAAFARRHDLPFLVIHGGGSRAGITTEGNLQTLELPRSRASFSLERDLSFDPFFARHLRRISRALDQFQPEVIHITGPSELGILGAILAHRRRIPLVASWHTNVHEYAARRLAPITRRLLPSRSAALERRAEAAALWTTTRFYRLAKLLFAPNGELCTLLEHATGRPCHLMQRGVDTGLFDPARRTRPRLPDQPLVLGYVGRLSVEKNISLLPRIEQQLAGLGITHTRFLIVGHGSEQPRLQAELGRADFPGVLRGTALAEAYANMDLLVFPSHTDTFGNVVLEALASGVPAIVTTGGGPKYIVRDGVTGLVATDNGFALAVASLARSPERLLRMGEAAREYALTCSWDAVFERVYAAYRTLPGLASAGPGELTH